MNKPYHYFPLVIVLMVMFFNYANSRADTQSDIYLPVVQNETYASAFAISDIRDNRADYPENLILKYEKFEITFQIQNSAAHNFQFPYDPSPPPGVDQDNPVYQGITVNAIFTPDNWQTTYSQPGFYYQDFIEDQVGSREWFYPTNDFSWKVRFSPHLPGIWQYKLTALDASGYIETSPRSFTVSNSSKSGFVKVSPTDPRYFELDDGSYFAGLGYNMNFNELSWTNPTLDNESDFQTMKQNGIELIRIWLSQWGIFSSAWNPWNSIIPEQHAQYIPFAGMASAGANAAMGSETSMIVNANHNPCMFIGWMKASPTVKPNTNYRIRVRYKTEDILGPRIAGNPYGLVAKMGGTENGGWLWGDGPSCNDPGSGVVVSSYESQNSAELPDAWRTIEGTWNSDSYSFLPYFYLVMENVDQGRAFIDYVWIEEELGGGQYGANIVSKPWMSHHLYFEQRNSFAFDQVLDLADEYDIYLKPVILEKNEWSMNRILPDGSFDYENPSNDNFYGQWRETTKIRWLHQAWWRYLQARWGYSTQIHSWELSNEGDPGSNRHYALTDEFGKFMHCQVFDLPVGSGDGENCADVHPNAHLVSTSFWHSFPAAAFWANPNYANVDYADVHAYVSTGWIDEPLHEVDAAAYHLDYSQEARGWLDNASGSAPTKPIIRGEAGIDFSDEQGEQPDLALDVNGTWLHNTIWSSLDPGGMIEEYWWSHNREMNPGPDGQPGLHEIYGYFDDFIQDIPLSNGHYQDAQAQLSDPALRVVGQKDTTNNQAHLWVQNRAHTWRNVVDGVPGISGLSGTVTLGGFSPNISLDVEWHEFTTQGIPTIKNATAITDSSGNITLSLPTEQQITDVGIKISEN